MIIETKFSPDDPVVFMLGNKIHTGVIQYVETTSSVFSSMNKAIRTSVLYRLHDVCLFGERVTYDSYHRWAEQDLFDSKEALIKSL